MKQRLLVSSIIMGLCATLSVGTAIAQQSSGDASQDGKKKEATELQGVVVTGSLIPRAQIETASPTVTITADTMKREGFKNVYDALRSLPVATGSIADSQFTSGFTPGAGTVSLLGLDPSFTLVLMNGRPMADFPFLYNNQSNFVDLASVPAMIVDHIDILPGNQSAIYGSAAIAGVINIVTKQKMDGVTLDYRVGGYSDGGGSSQRVQIGGGSSFGKLDVLWALQAENQEPIFFRQRSYTNSTADNPTLNGAPPIATRDRVLADAAGKYVDPGSAACGKIGGLFHGTLQYSYRPNFGYYCGSIYDSSDGTMLNGQKMLSGYLSLKYQLNDTTQIYGDGTFNTMKVTYLSGGGYNEFFGANSAVGPFYDRDSGKVLTNAQYVIAPEEVRGANDSKLIEHNYIVNFGVRGSLGDSNWNYDAYFHRSQSKVDSKQRRMLTDNAIDWFLGPQDGTFNYKGRDLPAFHINQTGHFWNAMTPADYMGISDDVRSNSKTYTQNLNLTVTNTDLFSLPAGSVGFAGVLEGGNQLWDNPVDPRVTNGDFYNIGGNSGHGKRDRQAVALELTVPITSMLTADLATRWDRYKAAGSSQGKVTYKLGLEFRPFETLLIRGNYGTAFRAPDMGYIFSNGSTSFSSATVDYYNCRLQQGDHYNEDTCPQQQLKINSTGSKNLKYITAKSFGYGFVWSPTPDLNVKADYYHVKISNEVASYSSARILQNEADCRLGKTVSGVAVDINSPACQAFIAQVGRNPADDPFAPGALNSVRTYPINVASEMVSGVLLNAAYRFDVGRFGNVILGADYNTTLKHTQRTFPGDPETDYLRLNLWGLYQTQFKQIFSANATWNIDSWSATVRGQRYGKTWSADGSHTVGPWILYNASVQYNFTDDASMTLISNNIFNSRPPFDRSNSRFPYYDVFFYNGMGRSVMLEMNVHFGGTKK